MKKIRPTFSVVASATDTNVKKCTAREIRIECSKLVPVVAAIRSGAQDLKKQLPAVCWAAEFSDNKRHAATASPTGLVYLDIDHIATDPKEYYDNLLSGREEELGIVHVQVSPSGDGLHIVFIPSVIEDVEGGGNTLEGAQQAFAKLAGIESYDAQCKDISRLLFLTSVNDTLYDALDTLYE